MTSSAANSTNSNSTNAFAGSVASAEVSALVVVPCDDLGVAISQYERVGFVLNATGPADEPTWAEMEISGLRIQLDETAAASDGPKIQLGSVADRDGPLPDHVIAPPSSPGPLVVSQSLTVLHEEDGDWISGRAGMLYRDLIPDRFGGAFIASHIHVPGAGPVPDYVHHHDISFQLIFCHRGWVRVVYQDQGPDFVLEPGDCVLQPPGLRHQVLESSGDLFVTEITCPADHRTSLDHHLALPNDDLEAARRYAGQLFVRHDSSEAAWTGAAEAGFEEQVTSIARATDGHGSVRLLRPSVPGDRSLSVAHEADLRLLFVVTGSAQLAPPDHTTTTLAEGASAAIPAGEEFALANFSADTVLLDVTYQI